MRPQQKLRGMKAVVAEHQLDSGISLDTSANPEGRGQPSSTGCEMSLEALPHTVQSCIYSQERVRLVHRHILADDLGIVE